MWASGSTSRSTRLAALLAALCLSQAAKAADVPAEERLRLLLAAYPDSGLRLEAGLLMLPNGRVLKFDDGIAKTHAEALDKADVEDSLAQIYPMGPCAPAPAEDVEPGRIRSDLLMKALWGSTQAEVRAELVTVDWFGEKLEVNRRHGLPEALAAVREELAPRRDLRGYLIPSAGTFNWRTIAGTKRLSVHSFGAAIDINTRYADYWIWSGGSDTRVPVFVNRVPPDIVEVFERHGFIWGGRWYRYDTMHFEYRPELIAISRAANASACE